MFIVVVEGLYKRCIGFLDGSLQGFYGFYGKAIDLVGF